jgi:hypothetical protein
MQTPTSVAPLPINSFQTPPGGPITTIGYGDIVNPNPSRTSPPTFGDKYTVQLPNWDYALPNLVESPGPSKNTFLRASSTTTNVCGGDSGGPAIMRGVVVGVTSGGDPTCSQFSLFAEVDQHAAFVLPYTYTPAMYLAPTVGAYDEGWSVEYGYQISPVNLATTSLQFYDTAAPNTILSTQRATTANGAVYFAIPDAASTYAARMVDNHGNVLAQGPTIHVAPPRVTTDKAAYARGQTIQVGLAYAPGGMANFIGLALASAPVGTNAAATAPGSVGWSTSSESITIPTSVSSGPRTVE